MPARTLPRVLHVAAACLLVLTILPSPAEGAGERMAPGAPVMSLYMTGAPPGPMATTAPTAATPQSASIVATAMTPGASAAPITLGTFTPAVDMTFLSDGVAVYWIVSDNAAAWTQIDATILDGATQVIRSSAAPVQPPTVTAATPATAATVSQVRIPMALAGIELKGGTTYTLSTRTFGVGVSLKVLYDSIDRPSGLFAAVSDPAAFPTTASAFNVFFAKDRKLTTELPTAATDESTPLPTACTNACIALQSPVEWGTLTATTDAVVAGETILTLWVRASTAAVVRGINSNLVIGETTYAGQAWLGTTAQAFGPSPGTPERVYRFTYATRGAEIKAGDEIKISFGMWSTTDLPTGTLNLLYGSAAKPAGAMIPIVGSGSGPGAVQLPIHENVTTPALDIRHAFVTPTTATYTYNWTSNLTSAVATYSANLTNGSVGLSVQDGANVTVLDALLNATSNQTAQLATTTAGNWTVTLTFANFTGMFSLGIAEPVAGGQGGPGQTGSASRSETGSSTVPSGTDGNVTGGEDSAGQDTPAPALGIVLAALAALVLVRRRKA